MSLMSLILTWEIFKFTDLLLCALFYWLANLIVQVYFELAKITSSIVVSNGPLQNVIQRVMVLAGIYALFKLAITLINYAINPEKTDENSKNGIKIVQNIFVAIVLLSISSTAFEYLGKVSEAIFTRDNGTSLMERVVFGELNTSRQTNNREARALVNRFFTLFLDDHGKCDTKPDDTGCKYYIAMRDGRLNVDASMNDLLSNIGFTYYPVISWICAIFIIVIFVRYAFDLSKRLLKLVVLQIISPVPIIMYIDPKQKNRLTLFLKTYLSIWLQVFIRILSVYLAVALIDLVSSGEILSEVNSGIKWIAKFILYIGILFGMQEIPKLIDDIIGTKLAAETKGMKFGVILKGIVGGTAGTVGGAVRGGMAGAAAGGGFKKIASGMLAGSASGLRNGLKARNAKNMFDFVSTIGKSFSGAYKTGGQVAKAGFGGFAMGKINNMTGYTSKVDKNVATASEKVENHKKLEEAIFAAYAKDQKVSSINELIENDSTLQIAINNRTTALEQARNGGRTLDQDTLARLTNNINVARDNAKKRVEEAAYNNVKAIDIESLRSKHKTPEEIAKLSDVERAFYRLVKADSKADLLAADGKISKKKADDYKEEAKKEEKTAKAAQESDKYDNAKFFNSK